MSLRQALAGLLQIMTVFLFFGVGFLFVCLPFHPEVRIQLSDYLMTRPDLCTWAGLFFFTLAFLFSLGYYAATKGRYLLLRSGNHVSRIDAKIVAKTMSPLLERQYSSALVLSDVEIMQGGTHLELRVRMHQLEPEEKAKLLIDADRYVGKLLAERFGYYRPYTLQVIEL